MPEHLRCVLPPPEELDRRQLILLVELILEFQDVFVGPDGLVGRTTLLRHKIDVGDAEPFKCHPRKKSPMEREHIAKEVQKLLDEGFIRPSMSPWGAPVVLAKKKDGTLRFCIDYRNLNKVTKKDAYPLPRIEECLDTLHGMVLFCSMDMAKGYWQVPMDSDSIEKTAFTTHVGLFEWNVLPFGLCNAPATFCRLMEMVLADIVWKHCLVYLDDVIAFGRSFEECLTSLRECFLRFRAYNLKLKPSKCEFFRDKVEYLGHEVGAEGLRPSKSKVQALHDWKIPTDLTGVKSFLGFTSFYRRYIENYSAIAKPLTEMTKGPKGKPWVPLGAEQIKAFELLIAALSKRVLLHHVRDDSEFYLTTDASNYAIGAALEQIHDKERVPIAFASKTLPESRTHYCATKKELYAIVYFMRYFVGFYRGQKVNIETDHYALQWLWNFQDPVDSMYYRWMTEMNNYQPWEIIYLPGKHNVVADALSRRNKPVSESPRPYKDCRIENCPICEHHFRKDRNCRDSDSPEDDEVPGAAKAGENKVSSCIQHVKSRFVERIGSPDDDDIPLWELWLVRANDDPEVTELLADLTSLEIEELPQERAMVNREAEQPPELRRSARIAARKEKVTPEKLGTPSIPHEDERVQIRDRKQRVKRPSTAEAEPRRDGEMPANARKREMCDTGEEAESPASEPARSESDLDENDPMGSTSDAETSTPAGDNNAAGDSETPPATRTLPEAENILKSLLTSYTDEDWISAQKADLVIQRLIYFLSRGTGKPEPEEIKKETMTLQALLRDWDALVYKDGILCRRILRDDHTTCESCHLQRLVPVKWQMELWGHIHGIECRHLSYEKVYDMLSRNYYWYGMSTDLLSWCRACVTCQKAKPGIGRGREPLKQDYTSRRNQRVGMDLVGTLPTTGNGNTYIMVMQDYYTKWVEITPLPNKKAVTVAQSILATWVCRWGCPEALHSDQGNEFDAVVIHEMCDLLGIKKTRTLPFNPPSNGMVERTNRTLKGLLRQMATENFMVSWDTKLPLAMMAINNVIHSTTGFTPFRLQVAGNEDMTIPADVMFGKPNSLNFHCYQDFVHQLELSMKEVYELVRMHTQKQMNFQREAHDKGPMKIRKYTIGDMCLRYYPPWAQQKLHPFDWQGPYKIVDVDTDGLKVKLQDVPGKGRGKHDTWVHVSALKPVILTKCGMLLQQQEDGRWAELPVKAPIGKAGAQTSSPTSSSAGGGRPAIAGFENPTIAETMSLAMTNGVFVPM